MRSNQVLWLAGLLACHPSSHPSQVVGELDTDVVSPAAPAVAPKPPDDLPVIKQRWDDEVMPHVRAALSSGRAGPIGAWNWTDNQRAALDGARERARAVIAEASPSDRPWLLIAYSESFSLFGLGTEQANALIAIPPEHPAWDLAQSSLLDRAREASDPLAVEACVHAVAELHDSPFIDAESLFLRLREADRVGDWERAKALAASLNAIEVGPVDDRRSILGHLNVDVASYLPDRSLRTGTRVPDFCAASLDGERLVQQCLPDLFPFSEPTLILGSASWCVPCREVVAAALETASARGLRVLLINYDDRVYKATAYRAEHGLDAAPILLPQVADDFAPTGPSDLVLPPIPFVALVDEQGMVVLGRPWLDLEALASMREDLLTP